MVLGSAVHETMKQQTCHFKLSLNCGVESASASDGTQMSLLESFIISVSTRSAKARTPRSGPVPIPPHQPHIDVAGNPAAAPDHFKSHGRLPAAMRESAISGFFFCRQSNCFAICRAAGKATALGYRDLLFTQQ
jgi:hypothetical protein